LNLSQVNELEHLFCKLSVAVHKGKGPEKLIADFEASLSRTLERDWIRLAKRATRSGMSKFRGSGTRGEINSINKAIAAAMKPFPTVASAMEKEIAVFYKDIQKRFIKEFDLEQAVEKASKIPSGDIVFSTKDANAIGAIQRVGTASAGKYFPEQVAGFVSQVVEQVVLNEGLSTADAAVKLSAELNAALGTGVEQVVPTSFATNPGNYFETLAINSSTQASSMGNLIAMDEAGIEVYEIVAVIDKRTSDICRKLDGKKFRVADAMGTVNKVSSAEDPEDLEDVMPFQSRGIGHDGDTIAPPKWSESGDGFPPYHHRCRTRLVPVVDV